MEGYIDTRSVIGFADHVWQAELIAVGTVREILPSRWNTPDGSRPPNPHAFKSLSDIRRLMITPVRIEFERLAKGSYPSANLYLAMDGGQIGQDCAIVHLGQAELTVGERGLFLVSETHDVVQPPLPGDDQYRFYSELEFYPVASDGTISFYMESGTPVQRPLTFRRIPLDQAIQEIPAILAAPSPTPAR